MKHMKKYLSAGACVAFLLTAVGVSALANENTGDLTVSGGDAIVEQEQEAVAVDENLVASEPEESHTVILDAEGDEVATVTVPVEEPALATGSTISPVDVIGGPEGIHGVLNGDSIAIELEEDTRQEYDVIAMQVPKNINFVMDPYNLCGKGSVWSETYVFRNSGTTAVSLKMSDIRSVGKENVRIADVAEAREDIIGAADKTIRLRLHMDSGENVNITEAGSEYEVIMQPGSAFSFSVEGDLSLAPEENWMSGDVSISLVYDVQLLEAEEE